jgi:hypothetical protein
MLFVVHVMLKRMHLADHPIDKEIKTGFAHLCLYLALPIYFLLRHSMLIKQVTG